VKPADRSFINSVFFSIKNAAILFYCVKWQKVWFGPLLLEAESEALFATWFSDFAQVALHGKIFPAANREIRHDAS